MNDRKVGRNISGLINRIHGTDNRPPLKEGVGYSIESTQINSKPNEQQEESPMMDEKTFNELLEKGELSLILMDGGANLTPRQLAKVKSVGKALSDEKLQNMAFELASSPGYQEMMLTPLMSKLIPQVFSIGDDNSKTIKHKPEQEQPEVNNKSETKENKEESEPKQKITSKRDALFATVGPGPAKHLRSKDSAADILAKMFVLEQQKYSWDKKKSKKDKKYRARLDAQKERFLEETVEALTGKKPSYTKKLGRMVKKSRILKYGLIGAGLAGSLLLSKSAFAKIDMSSIFPKIETKADIDTGITGTSKDEGGARTSAEEYLGRKMSDKEWDMLIRTTSAEASNKSTAEQSGIMATILNRARDDKKSIEDVLMQKGQFQAVTGKSGEGFHPSQKYLAGPTAAERESINYGAINLLPKVSRKQKHFTAYSKEAYTGQEGLKFREQLLNKPDSSVVGGTIFETVLPKMESKELSYTPIKGVTDLTTLTAWDPEYAKKKNVFGSKRDDGHIHQGLDLGRTEGESVTARQTGKVVRVEPKQGYGNTILIKHEDGTYAFYAHLKDKGDVVVGDSVKMGQSIGRAGKTTGARGEDSKSMVPHLHLEYWDKNGKPIDPNSWNQQQAKLILEQRNDLASKLGQIPKKDIASTKGTNISLSNQNTNNIFETNVYSSNKTSNYSPVLANQYPVYRN